MRVLAFLPACITRADHAAHNMQMARAPHKRHHRDGRSVRINSATPVQSCVCPRPPVHIRRRACDLRMRACVSMPGSPGAQARSSAAAWSTNLSHEAPREGQSAAIALHRACSAPRRVPACLALPAPAPSHQPVHTHTAAHARSRPYPSHASWTRMGMVGRAALRTRPPRGPAPPGVPCARAPCERLPPPLDTIDGTRGPRAVECRIVP